MGSLDEQGFIRISGRKKDLIIRGGHNIEPRVIEEALLHSPAVALAAAVGKPDSHAGELPVAYVQLHPGAKATSQELIAIAAAHISERPAVPKEVIIMEQLPLTAVGKPQKHLLQLDAARRAMEHALKEVQGNWQLDVGIEQGGLMLTVKMAPQQELARSQVQEILSNFAIRSRVLEA
ncbi:MAG: AMP-binding enzyme [Hylemonella sp.]